VFTPDDRKRLQDQLTSAARADGRIAGAALTGSQALDREDRWSDIDIALSVSTEAERSAVIADWTEQMYAEYEAVEHLDVVHGSAHYRVFLLADSLQVDLAFWPEAEFGPIGPKFRLLFGAAAPRAEVPPPTVAELAGMGWLYAMHAYRCIERKRPWQAEQMISGARDQVLALACLRHGLPTTQGRGIDELPLEVTGPVDKAIVRSLDGAELKRALAALVDLLLAEVGLGDPEMSDRLAQPLKRFVD
jgi:predicted nucleotidyltransferase